MSAFSSEPRPAPALPPGLDVLPGETVLWTGRPDPAFRFVLADAALIPVGLLWCGYAVFMVFLSSQAGPIALAFSLPATVAGLYLVVGRAVVKKRRRLRTVYTLTTRRAVVTVGTAARETPLEGQPIAIRQSRDGSRARVIFGPIPVWRPLKFWGSPSEWRSPERWPLPPALLLDAGLDFLPMPDRPVGFYDVSHPVALLAALDQVGRTPA